MVEMSCPCSSNGFALRAREKMSLKSDEKNYIILRVVGPTRPVPKTDSNWKF